MGGGGDELHGLLPKEAGTDRIISPGLIPPPNSPTVIHAAIQTGLSCFAHFPPEDCSRPPVLSGGTIEYQSWVEPKTLRSPL